MEANEETSSWIAWTYVFGSVCGIIKMVGAKTSNEKVLKSLKAVYKAVKDVDAQFVYVVNKIKDGGNIPTVVLPPTKIDDWDDTTDFKGVIVDMLKNSVCLIIEKIEAVSSESPEIEKVLHALAGLITALDEYKTIIAINK